MDEDVQQQPVEAPATKTETTAIDYDKLADILDGRQKANEETVLKGYFKEQGLTGDQMAEAIKSFKDAQAAKAPDVSGMQAELADLRQAMEAANSAVNVAKVENVVIVEAMKMGIDPKVIPYLTRMADLTNVGDGSNISSEKVAMALGKVLEDIPALKPQAQEQTGFRVGGAGEKDSPAQLENEKLKNIFGVK